MEGVGRAGQELTQGEGAQHQAGYPVVDRREEAEEGGLRGDLTGCLEPVVLYSGEACLRHFQVHTGPTG